MEIKMQNHKKLENIKLFVLDMDGTFYLGNKILEGALGFIEKVKESGKDFIFFTNNSSKAPEDYMEKLKKMNCNIQRKDIMTSADVTIEFLKTQYKDAKVYLLGTKELEKSFIESGIPLVAEGPDIVVVGFDMTLTYEKLEKACTYIRNGAKFIATHLDINCPTEDGFIPDCGAICAAIQLSTGATPEYMGKPFDKTVELVTSRTKYKRDEIAFVGDRLYTDVATGVNNGCMGILVLTGETKLSDVETSLIQPDFIFNSLKEMGEVI
ncbi:MAG: HAD-superfamily hydrolase, subfamily [Anaerocolumna sp.]|jgi:HAD superfamily hydrolase (TIGR01457 family)|nr:HAD-superfamily hydrolase, subfamily [Anaerocolumna sp.]